MQFTSLKKSSYRKTIYSLFLLVGCLTLREAAFGEDQRELNRDGLSNTLNNASPSITALNDTGIYTTGEDTIPPPTIAQRSRLTVSIGHNISRSLSRVTEDRSDESISNIVSKIQHIVDNTSNHLTSIFLYSPKNTVSLKILSPEDFLKVTGAPSWTSALYYNGTIFIPLSFIPLSHNSISGSISGDPIAGKENMTELYNAIKHEYVHAFLAEFSDNRIPAWLDEGVAQYLEGQDNPRLAPALRNWLARNPPLPLDSLDHGFTTLKGSSVVVAYAESLFITRSLINRYGISKVAKLIKLLGQGESLPRSIKLALDIEKGDIEQDLARQLNAWAASRKTSL